MRSMRFEGTLWCILALVACVALGGCGPSTPATVPVSGTVTLDGQPLEGAAVSFVPIGQGRPATGQTDSSGKFTLTSFQPGDGAPAGKYKVGVSKLDKPADAKGGPAAAGAAPEGTRLSGPPVAKGPEAPPKSLVPPKYVNPDTSGLTVEVKSGMEPVKLELTSK
ncbi:MAG: hypothetical protein NUV77_05210 [Thermoguttaceae bacterium]|nr:hypothetical protein [Thermoguttaceae bacterium]